VDPVKNRIVPHSELSNFLEHSPEAEQIATGVAAPSPQLSQCNEVKDSLAEIDANGCDVHVMILLM
jgi:hypothetical protein